MNFPEGICHCGCGQPTLKRRKRYNKFINGHYPKGELSPHWKQGYRTVEEHIVLAEKALGKKLPKGSEVHHHDKNQLVICPDRAYHKLLHQRQKALEECGHANWRRCKFCKKYDDPKGMSSRLSGTSVLPTYHHQSCENLYARNQRLKRKNIVDELRRK